MMVTQQTFILTGFDTLFFRDGRPFNQSDEGLAEAVTLFPPSPRSIAGAMRAAIARAAGWRDCDGPWPENAADMPGNGDFLGGFSFSGPFPTLDGMANLLLPTPAHYHSRSDENGEYVYTLLGPGVRAHEVTSDASSLSMLGHETGEGGYKPLAGWLTAAAIGTALNGVCPNVQPIPASRLTAVEARVGLQRDKSLRVADEGMLYMAGRQRLREADGIGDSRVGLVVGVTSPSDRPQSLQTLTPVGGDARFAEVKVEAHMSLHKVLQGLCVEPPLAKNSLRYIAVLLTPVSAEIVKHNTGKTQVDGLPGQCRAIASGRACVIGGWRSGHGPVRSATMLPASSVLFMEASDGAEAQSQLTARRNSFRLALGPEDQQALGYGAFVYGAWPKWLN